MRYLVFLAPLLLSVGAAHADDVRVDRIEIVGKGVYAVETGQATQNPNTPTGAITAVDNVTNIEATTEIPASVGTEFGFQYKIVGEPSGAEVTLDFVNIYPEQGLRDPAGPGPVFESRYQRTKRIGETQYLGYGLENAWEAVPGSWTFQIWYDGRKLVDESFTVTE